ncbi:MAG: hypothetical protein GXX00_02680 [Hungateiclostridium thermocellum]|nr:hypothetical protein [Acetivibrio thermocellus]
MTKGAEELFREIELKNIILREQCNNCRLSRHELEKTERELDALLYKYYKLYNCNLC